MVISDADAVRLCFLRQQYEANERAFKLGQISEDEYHRTLNLVGMKIVMLEEKYGLYEEL